MVIAAIGILDSLILTILIILTYFKGYQYIIDKRVLFTMTDVYSAFAFSIMIVSFLVFLFSTRFNDLFFNFIRRHRNPIKRESDRLYPLIEEIQKEIDEKLHKKRIKISLKISDVDEINAAAVGLNTVIVYRKLYEAYDDSVLKAVLAHEIGHIYNGDSCKAGINAMLFIVLLTIITSIGSVAFITWVIGKEKGGLMGLFAVLLALSMFTIFIMIFVIFWVFLIGLRIFNRRQEYQADKFAVQLGYHNELLLYLENFKEKDYILYNNWIKCLLITHPKAILRIGEIEKHMRTV